MPFPKSEELVKAGYKFSKTARCRGATCGAEIEWWVTPNTKSIPLDAVTLKPHWSTCPDREEFRRP